MTLQVHDPWVFFGASAALVAYLLYMMIRRRKGERPGVADREPELVGDLRLEDAEDDEFAEITMSAPLLKRYKDNLNAFVGGLREWCTKRGITYIFTTNQYPFDKLILNYLRERGLVK